MFCLYEKPIVFKQIVSQELCDLIIKSTPKMEDSGVIKKFTTKNIMKNEIRKSRHGWIREQNLLNILFNKCKHLLTCKNVVIESIQVVHYETEGFFKEHYDSGETIQRDFTFIVALNDDYEGGETYFPYLKKSFKLEKGDILFFHNHNTDGSFSNLSLHGGKPVKSGEKWICNIWVRKYPYS
jgi:prolyl 4-hydroxylase